MHTGPMNDGVLDVTEHAELQELRRRAYGPDADIETDPAALARLHELEDAAAAKPAATSDPSAPEAAAKPATDALPSPPDSSADAPAADPLETAEPSAPAQAPASPRVSRLRALAARTTATRRARLLTGIVAVVVVGLIGGVIGWQAAQPRADRVLAPTSETLAVAGDEQSILSGGYGLEGRLRGHEPYGALHAWTGRTHEGLECLVISLGEVAVDNIVGVGCAPDGLPASVDVFMWPGWSVQADLDLPVRSLVRFVRAGDQVRVTLAVPPHPSTTP